MKKTALSVGLLLVLLMTTWAHGEYAHAPSAGIGPQIRVILQDLSNIISRFDTLQKEMARHIERSDNSDEQRKVILSSVPVIAAISAVSEHEHDQLSLYIERSSKNRQRN